MTDGEKMTIHYEGIEQELLPTFLDLTKKLEEKGVSREKAEELRELALTRMMKINSRKQRGLGKEKIPKESIALASTEVLAQITQLAEQSLIDQAREQERLNPGLLSKSGARKDFDKKFEELSSTEDADSERMLVLVALDLDDFKTVNDTYGHESGDNVLKSFGKAMEDAMRPEDKGVHFSGDEFGFILDVRLDEETLKKEGGDRETTINNIIQRIVEKAQGKTERPDGKTQELSVGYSVVEKDQLGNYEDFLASADKASAMSKVLKIMEGSKGNELGSSDRIINQAKIEEIEGRYTPEEIAKAKALRGIKRELNILLETFDAKNIDALGEIAPCFDKLLEKISGGSK